MRPFSFAYTFASVTLTALLAGGCGEKPPYPTPQVTTAVGRSAVCEACGERIAEVSEENLTTIDGARFVVCDETCAEAQRHWMQNH